MPRGNNYARPIRVDKPALRALAASLAAGVHERLPQLREHETEPIDEWILQDVITEIPTVRGGREKIRVLVFSKLPGDVQSWQLYHAGAAQKAIVQDHILHDPIVTGGAFTLGRDQAGLRHLKIYINGVFSPRMLRNRKDFEQQLFSVLLHEASHGAEADFIPKEPSYPSSRGLRGLAAVNREARYYNTPTEVRAFGQQLVDEVLTNTAPTATISDRTIQRFLSRSPTWQRIMPHLTRRNEQLVLKMVWRALMERAADAGVEPWPARQRS